MAPMIRAHPRALVSVMLLACASCTIGKAPYPREAEECQKIESRGEEMYRAGDYEGAIAQFSILLDRYDGAYTIPHYLRGKARFATGDLDGAIDDYDRELVVHPHATVDHIQMVLRARRVAADAKATGQGYRRSPPPPIGWAADLDVDLAVAPVGS